MIDLIPNGSTQDEVILLAKEVERAGATIIKQELVGMRLEYLL